MKVLKFGGTSVGSVKSILNLKQIVEKAALEQPVAVAVSALGGITDKLISTGMMAQSGDEEYKNQFCEMMQRHHDMINEIISDEAKRMMLMHDIDQLFDQLKSIYFGVYLIHDLSKKTLDAIVSYGERLSSRIVAELINGAQLYDSRRFIKTEVKNGKNILDSDTTNRLICQTFASMPRIALMPGFISSDKTTGETTNLGRGGSDYTASLWQRRSMPRLLRYGPMWMGL